MEHSHHRQPILARRLKGVSMVEALCCLAVASTAAGVAVPGLESLRTLRQLEGTAAQLETDIQYARSEAVRTGQATRLSALAGDWGSCYVIYAGPAGDCRCDAEGHAVCRGSRTALRTVGMAAGDRVALRPLASSIAFDPDRGTVTPTATLKLVARDGRAVHHVINVMGRIRSCTPQGSALGYRTC